MFLEDQNVFNMLFEAVSEGIIVVDENQQIVAANTSAASMFGYSKDGLIGNTLNTLIPAKYHDGHPHYFHEFIKEGVSRKTFSTPAVKLNYSIIHVKISVKKE